MLKTFEVNLDLENQTANSAFTISQNDLKTIEIIFTVTQDKKPLDLTGTLPRIAILKPSGNTVIQDCTLDADPTKGNFQVILDSQAYVEVGVHTCEVYIYSGDQVAVTGTFTYNSRIGIFSDTTLTSTNDWQAINDALANYMTNDQAKALIDSIIAQNGGVNLQNYYTKTDVDTQMASVNASLADKANKSDINTARPVIWDTDWWTDVDDAMAARVLVWAERMGMIDIVCLGISACMQYSVASLDAFFLGEGRRGLTIGIDSAATDFGGSPAYQANLANNNLHDYQSNAGAEDVVRMYRRALATATKKIDFIAVGYPQTLANLLKSSADDISPLTGLQLFQNNVNKVWMMAGNYPSGLENNFKRNARSIAGGSYFVANCPVPITFLGYEVGVSVITGDTLPSVSPAADDLLTKALADWGTTTGRSAWDPMLTLLACYGDTNMAGYQTVKGTNVVDATTGANTFTPDPNGKHEYVVKIQTDNWYKRIINSILEKKSWGARKVGGQQLPKLNSATDTTPPVITASKAAGTYSGTQSISLSSNEGALIFYTTDGTTPTTASTRYTVPIAISATTTLKFIGIDAAGNVSAVQSATYTITAPTDSTNLIAYWSANDLSGTADGTAISTVNDKSTAGNTLTSPSSSESPLFYSNKNGKPALKFTGASKLLTNAVAMPTNMTVYMKVAWDTLPTANQTILSQDPGGSTSANRLWHETVDATSFKGISFNWNGTTLTGQTDQQTGTLDTTNWHTFAAVHTPTTLEAFFDGVSNGAMTINTPNTGTQKIAVGGTYNGSGVWSEALVGYVTEIRIYAAAHDSTTIASVISNMG